MALVLLKSFNLTRIQRTTIKRMFSSKQQIFLNAIGAVPNQASPRNKNFAENLAIISRCYKEEASPLWGEANGRAQRHDPLAGAWLQLRVLEQEVRLQPARGRFNGGGGKVHAMYRPGARVTETLASRQRTAVVL